MPESSPNRKFKTTQWSVVIGSQEEDSDVRIQSLNELCQSYWYPLFAYLRRKGYAPEDAADYVQGFFVELIEKDFLEAVSPEKGRFRWFLKSAIGRFVSKQVDRQRAQKRGGNADIISIDVENAEQRYQLEPVDGLTAEKLFERRWALAVLQQALQRLGNERKSKGKRDLYLALQSTLTGIQISQERYEEIAARFGMSPGAVKVAAMRLREKYRKTLKDVVAQTISDSELIDDELDELLTAIRG